MKKVGLWMYKNDDVVNAALSWQEKASDSMT